MINSNSRSNNSNTSNKAYNDDKKINVVVVDEDHPLTIINKEDSNFQLSFLLSSSSSSQSQSQSQSPSSPPLPIIKIAIWKNTRLEQLDISKDFIELLYINGFTIERIMEYGPLQIAQILGIDE